MLRYSSTNLSQHHVPFNMWNDLCPKFVRVSSFFCFCFILQFECQMRSLRILTHTYSRPHTHTHTHIHPRNACQYKDARDSSIGSSHEGTENNKIHWDNFYLFLMNNNSNYILLYHIEIDRERERALLVGALGATGAVPGIQADVLIYVLSLLFSGPGWGKRHCAMFCNQLQN